MENTEKSEILLAIKELSNKMDNMQKDVDEIKEVIPEMQVEIRKISKSVAVIEVEHGEKLDLLFDIFDMHEEKLKSNERRIHLCERHLDRHDDEIYYLKEVQRA